MANYIKSEFYRVSRSRGIYLLVGAVAVLVLAMNVLLAVMNTVDKNFGYGTMGFSLAMLYTTMSMPMLISIFMSFLIFADEYKNRTMTNTVAFGLPEAKVMAGKYVVTLIVAFIAFVVVEAVLVISAYLLLGNTGWNNSADGMESLRQLLEADIACIPLFMAGIAIYYALLFWMRNEMHAVWGWLAGVAGVGQVVGLLGMKFSFFQKVEKILIYRLVGMYDYDEENGLRLIWETANGRIWCVMVGLVTTVIFLALAVIGSRKKR